jgi:hypothetical protein
MARMPSGRPSSNAETSPASAAGAALQLEISDGAWSRRVAVAGPRITIGGHEACDVCLGDPFPPLHCLLIVDEAAVWLEAVVADPPVRVNGAGCESSELVDGDRIELGHLRMTVRRHSTSQLAAEEKGEIGAVDERLPAEMSAAELVDAIEREQELVDRFEALRDAGAEALLDAAVSQGVDVAVDEDATDATAVRLRLVGISAEDVHPPAGDNYPIAHTAGSVPSERPSLDLRSFEAVAESLAQIAAELDRRAARLAEREQRQAEATAALLEMQQRLAEQIEGALSRIAALETAKPLPTRNVA